MKQSEIFRENAENCAHLAESASDEPAYQRYKRMEAAWSALADEQDWLDGEVLPVGGVLPSIDADPVFGFKSGKRDKRRLSFCRVEWFPEPGARHHGSCRPRPDPL